MMAKIIGFTALLGVLAFVAWPAVVSIVLGPTAAAGVLLPPRQVPHVNGLEVYDQASHDLPAFEIGGRVMELMHGDHFDCMLKDTSDELRPPSLIAFYDSTDASCVAEYARMGFEDAASNELPARERLLIAKYDTYSAPRRAWYKWVPERDLAARTGVDTSATCPQLVLVPRACNGYTEWCDQGNGVVGCEDFVDQCKDYKLWDGKGDWKKWVTDFIEEEGEPQIAPFFGSYHETSKWLLARDDVSVNNQMRNVYLAAALPAFTEVGYSVRKIPDEVMTKLLNFFNAHKAAGLTPEFWSGSATQINFHDVRTAIVSLDRDPRLRDHVANDLIRPLVEEWSGMKDLELTSFYGIREYYPGSMLVPHVDRSTTHVLSVTMALSKGNGTSSWPLEVVDWNGDNVRYEHPPGYMVFYESAKLIHGRPTRLPDGTHLGAFCHFRPRTFTHTDGKKWVGQIQEAENWMQRHIRRVPYHTTPTVEPENPVYTERPIGEGLKWNMAAKPAQKKDPGSVSVEFTNNSKQDLVLYWRNTNTRPIEHQLAATVLKGGSANINTYHGHQFIWGEYGTDDVTQVGEVVTIVRGKVAYAVSDAHDEL